jgi:VanZ family protein
MRRVVLIVVALILYGSLYPWEFHARQLGASPAWILLHSWPNAINRYMLWDVIVNVVLYAPLGVFGFLAMSEGSPRAVRIFTPVLLALALSASVEMIQLFDDSRQCSASDVLCNVTGGALGVGLGMLYREKLQAVLERRQTASFLHLSEALLLLCCWLGYQLFPLFPSLGRAKLAARLAALGTISTMSPVETLVVFAEWIAVACLLEGLLEGQTTHMLAALLLVVPARLLIVSRSLSWSDIGGAAAALAAWLWLPRLYVRRAAPFLLTSALIVGELAPFHFGPARAFNWVPFRGLILSDWQSGFVVLFRKSFWYGSAIWLWRAAGYRLAPVILAVAAALLALEGVQIYLPGRTPEITDAVLAVLMGLLLGLVGAPRKPAPDRH